MPNKPSSALTLTSNGGLLRVLKTQCQLCAAFNPALDPAARPPLQEFVAIWDTGATHSVITKPVVDRCRLKPTGMTQTQGVHGVRMAETYLINMRLPNGIGFANIPVTLGELSADVHALIGMDIITTGDFSITNHGKRTVFSFRCPSMGHVDFVAEGKQFVNRGKNTSQGGFSGGHHKKRR